MAWQTSSGGASGGASGGVSGGASGTKCNALPTVASDVMHLSYRMKEKAEELLGLMPVTDDDRSKGRE